MNKFVFFALIFSVGMIPVSFADNFSLSGNDIHLNISTGQFSSFSIMMNNTVNETTRMNVTTNEIGKKFLFFDSLAELSPLENKRFTVGYFAPPIAEPKNYSTFLQFNNTIVNVTLQIVDTIEPSIGECAFDRTVQNSTKNITLICSQIEDNHAISHVFLLVNNQTFNLTRKFLSNYESQFSISAIGTFEVVVNAFDKSGNNASKSLGNITITSYFPVEISSLVSYGSIKKDAWVGKKIVSVLDATKISLILRNIAYVNESNASIFLRFKFPDGDFVIVKPNEIIERTVQSGAIDVEVQGAAFGDFNGFVEITVLGTSSTAKLQGNVVTYSVLPLSSFRWLGGDGTCYGIDTGFYSNSSTNCNFTFPIDFCPGGIVERCILPVPKSEFESNINLQQELFSAKSSASVRGIVAWVGWVLFVIVLVGWLVYYIFNNW